MHERPNRYMHSLNGMLTTTIWHNPRCSKSRQTLQLVRDRGIEPKIVEYLKQPPTAAELSDAIRLLGLSPRDLIRKKEAPYSELALADEGLGDAQLVATMIEHPVLIERPIVFHDGRAAVGRPPEQVLALFD